MTTKYTAREKARAIKDLGDTRSLSRAEFLAALEEALTKRYGTR